MRWTLFVSILWLALTFCSSAFGADRYWIVGSGTWTSTANRSATAGGTGGATVPGASDTAIFRTGAGPYTVTFPLGHVHLRKNKAFSTASCHLR